MYRNSSDLDLYERWAFQGWSLTNYGDNSKPVNPSYLDVSNLTVTGNLIAYAHYVKEDVRKVATKEEYFNFTNVTVNIITGNKIISANGSLQDETKPYTGYRISVKDDYRGLLEGKITLPDTYNNLPIISVGDFSYTTKITHVFFLENSNNYVEFAEKAFSFENR